MIAYRPELDGLRAIAVLAVIANHAGLAGAGGGYVGVDVFFVISGYLITRMIADEAATGRFSIAGFYERRIRRIAPAFFAMTLVTSALALAVVPPADLRRFGQSVAATAVFGANVLFYRQEGYFDVLARMKPMLHTWSLAVEEQFYIVFPLVVLALYRWQRRRVAAGLYVLTALSFAACVWVTAHNPRAAFYQMPLRGWELLAGALLAIDAVPALPGRVARELAAIAGLALIGGAIALYSDATRFPGLAAAAPVVGAALVLHAHAGGASTWAGRVLGAAPIAFVGKISYSLYLWHWPLLVLSAYWRVDPAPHRVAAVLAVTAIVSVASWKFVEQPFRRRARWLTRPRLFAGMAAATALALGFGLATWASGGWPGRVSAQARALDGGAADYNHDRPRCHGSERRPIRFADKCVYGAPAVAPSVAIWGDSMAAEPAVALGRALGERGRALRYISYSSCPPAIDLAFGDRPGCAAHNADVLAHLAADPAIAKVVLIAQYVRYDRRLGSRYRASLAEVTARLVAAGKQVYVVYPVPTPPGRVPMMLARYVEQGRAPEALHVDRAAYLAENRATLDFLDELTARPGVHAVRVDRALCDDRRCAVYAAGKPLYFDDRHLSVTGAEHVLPAFAAVLE